MVSSVPKGRTPVAEDEVPGIPRLSEVASTVRANRLGILDLALVAAALTSLTLSCVFISARKAFWNDEIIAWKVITDPSIRHMIWAVAHACDGAPPAFHLFGRGWAQLFGSSVLSLRLFSCAGMCGAVIGTWVTLRRHFRLRAVAFAVFSGLCTSTLVLNYAAEARNYGLFMACVAASIVVVDAIATRRTATTRELVGLFAITCLLVYSHYYGLLYSALLLLAFLLSDAYRKRFHPSAYGAIVAGWIPLLLWIAPIAREQALFRERSYFLPPDTVDLLHLYSTYLHVGPLVLFLAICIATALLCGRVNHAKASDHGGDASLITIGAVLATSPLLLYFVARAGYGAFAERYVSPSTIGIAILMAWFADRCLSVLPDLASRSDLSSMLLSSAWLLLFVYILAGAVRESRAWPLTVPAGSEIESLAPPGVPVVVEDQHAWMQAMFFAGTNSRYYYVLDRDLAFAPESARNEPFFYNERIAWRKAGYWTANVVPSSEFLCRFPRFAVFDSPGRLWLTKRVLTNPNFKVESVHDARAGRLVVVERRPGASVGACAGGVTFESRP